MIRNYLLIALRNFQRQKMFAVLNMFGLALGLASAILIFLYVSDELQYDTMHPFYGNTYRIGTTFTQSDGEEFKNTSSPGIWVKTLKDNRTEVIDATRIDYIGYPTSLHHKATDRIILTEEIKWAEPGFDKLFDFQLVAGSKEHMFDEYYSILLSESGARRLFDDRDPMGEMVTVKHNFATNGREIELVVTGIYKELPVNSTFKPKFIINLNAFHAIYPDMNNYMEGSRFGNSPETRIEFFENYVTLTEGTSPQEMEKVLQPVADHMIQADSALSARGLKMTPTLTAMSALHFDPENLWENTGIRGDKTTLAIFSSVAILILLIACINYMNLATARSARRAKEVGLRKSYGSKRSEIAFQFFYESALMTGGSLLLAIVLVLVMLHPFNQLAHKSFTASSLLNPYMISITLGIVLLMIFIAGSYPAIYLSGFRPVEVLKGQLIKGKGADLFRKSLVTLQYAISLVLIIATFIVIRQMDFIQKSKLNEQGSQLLSIRYGGNAPQNKYQAFKESVLQDPDIEHVTMANHLPRLDYFGFIGIRTRFPEISDVEHEWSQLNVDFDFPKTYGLEFVAGRDFDPANIADSSSVILNEAAIKALGQPIERILGSTVTISQFREDQTMKVIGVVKDFPYKSMHHVIDPLALSPRVHQIDKIAYVTLPPGKFQEKIQMIEKKWKEIYPGVAFDYWFLRDEFNRMYVTEGRISSLSKAFAGLAIVITALGVFGLASYTAEQKTKEVGIRKVLGATIGQMMTMLIWIFAKIFIIACVIAVPVSYFIADYWLSGFVYRSPIGVGVFVISLCGLKMITLITVSYETWKSATTNPVNSLRSE